MMMCYNISDEKRGIMLKKEDVLKHKKQEKETALNNWHLKKVSMSKKFIDEEETQKSRNMARGSVHLCELGENIGSEQGDERPVIIISNNRINSTSSNVLVIPLSKTLKKKTITNRKKKRIEVPKVKTHYFLKKNKYTFLDYDSSAMTEGLKVVSKIRIRKHLGEISDPKDLNAILSRIKWIFEI